MKNFLGARKSMFVLVLLASIRMYAAPRFIPAAHPNLQYFGRWDTSDSLRFKHSWPGVAVQAVFTGRSIGVRMADSDNYYNVYIDGTLHRVFHGAHPEERDYVLADSLPQGPHTLLLAKRNCAQNKIYSFAGLLLEDGAALLSPPPKPARKIEFIGDSFTVAEGNEATVAQMPWLETFPVSNSDEGFAPIIARHFNAQYHLTARSGIGMVCDWTGDRTLNLPDRFDRALMDAQEPRWDFAQWRPELVVICLGLNDFSGLKEKNGKVAAENSMRYRKQYRDFLATVRSVYPGVTVLAVAAHVEWMRENVQQVVHEERARGMRDIHYAQFDYFEGGYVANGHPSAATHHNIAAQLLAALEAASIFAPR